MSVLVPDPATTDWVPLWSLGGQGAMTLIEEKIAGAAVPSFDFQNIPATYKHLMLIWDGISDTGGDTVLQLRANGDSGANYDTQAMYVSGTAVTAAAGAAEQSFSRAGVLASGSASVNARSSGIIDVPVYAGTAFRKSFLSRHGTHGAQARFESAYGQWRSAVAINRLTLTPGAGNFVAGSRATLYGIGDAVPTPQPATPALTLINDVTLGADGAFDFTSVPQTFKSLLLLTELRSAVAAGQDFFVVRLNGDTGNNYVSWGFGSSTTGAVALQGGVAGAAPRPVLPVPGATALANTYGFGTTRLGSYAATDRLKAYQADGGDGTLGSQFTMSFRWLSLAAINRIEVLSSGGAGGAFKAGSRATLYGLG